MLRRSLIFVVSAVLLGVVSGCNKYTCDEACLQFYGTAENSDGYDQCRQQPLQVTSGDTPAQAADKCIAACEDALYTTNNSASGTDDGRGNQNLQTEDDALDFIECVVERDYSPELNATTCDDLNFDCQWFVW